MDTTRFLGLPLDIRTHVYYMIDGSFTDLIPGTLQAFYMDIPSQSDNEIVITAYQKRLLKKLYPIFTTYLGMFEYNADLVYKWLEYAMWLRYDALVLDCLRVNHAYEGQLLGSFDWIFLSEKLRLGYFNAQTLLLQFWYTRHEYFKWVVEADNIGEYNPETPYLRLSMDILKPPLINFTLDLLEKKKLLQSIYEVWLDQEEEEEEDVSEDDLSSSSISDFDSNSGTEVGYRPLKRRKHTKDKKGKLTSNEIKAKLHRGSVMTVMNKLKSMKNLKKLYVRGDFLYDTLINSHGPREKPGQSINYLVKRRINIIELHQINNLTNNGITDFTKWDNLRSLLIKNVKLIDLNAFILPEKCSTLIIKNVQHLKWWNVELILKQMSLSPGEIFEKIPNSHTVELRSSINDEIKYTVRKMLWDTFNRLDKVILYRVSKIDGPIYVPQSLYNNARIKILNCRDVPLVALV